MSSRAFTDSVVQDAVLVWPEALGHAVLHGPDIAAGEPFTDPSDPTCRDVLERELAFGRCTGIPASPCATQCVE